MTVSLLILLHSHTAGCKETFSWRQQPVTVAEKAWELLGFKISTN